MLLKFVSLLSWAAIVSAAADPIWPGPRTTTQLNGEEVYIASEFPDKEPTTYKGM